MVAPPRTVARAASVRPVTTAATAASPRKKPRLPSWNGRQSLAGRSARGSTRMRRNPVTIWSITQNSTPTTTTSVARPAASHCCARLRATLPDEQAALTTRLGPVQPWRWARTEPIEVWRTRGNRLGRGVPPEKKLSRTVRMSEMPVPMSTATTAPGCHPLPVASATASSTAATTACS